jgi:DNA-binding LacI/PurR family transcriptional regulator
MGSQRTIKELQNIINRDLKLGVKVLAPERCLAQSMGVSRYEIKRAVAVLKAKGILESRRGSGVYIREDYSQNIKAYKTSRKAIAVGFYNKLTPSDVFYMKIFDAFEKIMHENQLEISFFGNLKQRSSQLELRQLISKRKVNGFIAVPGVPEQFTIELAEEIPTVTLLSAIGNSISCVDINKYLVGLIAGEYLIKCNCCRLGYVSNLSLEYLDVQQNLSGLRTATKFCGGNLTDDDIFYLSGFSGKTPRKSMRSLLKLAEVDGLLVRDDLIADMLVREFKKVGIRVPEDVMIIGVGNYEKGRLFELPLTSIDIRMDKICLEAIKIISRKSSAKNSVFARTLIEPELVIRNSTMN